MIITLATARRRRQACQKGVLRFLFSTYMASNRKIWKSKKAAQYIFIGILILVLVVVIYDKKKERTIAPQYMLNDKLSAAFEYTIRNDRTAPSPDASDFVKIYIPEDSRGKVSFKGI